MSQQVLDRPTTGNDLATLRNASEAAALLFPPLNTLDRCDGSVRSVMNDGTKVSSRCGAQAFVRVVLPTGADLLFCGHCIGEQYEGMNATTEHAKKIVSRRKALLDAGAHFVSQYDTINLKPTDTTPQTAKGF